MESIHFTSHFFPLPEDREYCEHCDLNRANHGPKGECADAEDRYSRIHNKDRLAEVLSAALDFCMGVTPEEAERIAEEIAGQEI